jgi:hypothetical protein
LVLPPEYSSLLTRGIAVLRRAEAELRRIATTDSAPPDPWHRIRELHGLAGRLADCDDWQWRTGFARVNFSPSDPELLDGLINANAWVSPYRDAEVALFTASDKATLAEVRRFLASYIFGEFEFEDIEPIHPGDAPPVPGE